MAQKLTPQQARVIARDEAAYRSAKRALEEARARRDETRARYRELLPEGERVDAGGVRIKVIRKSTGRKFRLKEYLEKHRLTKAMEPFVTQASTYEDWQVGEVKA